MPRLLSLWHAMHFLFKIRTISRSKITVVLTTSCESTERGQNVQLIVSAAADMRSAFFIVFQSTVGRWLPSIIALVHDLAWTTLYYLEGDLLSLAGTSWTSCNV